MRNDELPREGLSSEQSEPSKESGQTQPKEDWRQSLFEWLQLLVMVLGICGFANMWLAVFADVGVAILAILNAMRCKNVSRLRK